MDDKGTIDKTDYKALKLDVEYYQSLLDDHDIPEDQKRELIETLWQIIVSFVDLGFGIHPLQKVDKTIENKIHPAITKMIAETANEDLDKDKETHTERSEA